MPSLRYRVYDTEFKVPSLQSTQSWSYTVATKHAACIKHMAPKKSAPNEPQKGVWRSFQIWPTATLDATTTISAALWTQHRPSCGCTPRSRSRLDDTSTWHQNKAFRTNHRKACGSDSRSGHRLTPPPFLAIYPPSIETSTAVHRAREGDTMTQAHGSKRERHKRTTGRRAVPTTPLSLCDKRMTTGPSNRRAM